MKFLRFAILCVVLMLCHGLVFAQGGGTSMGTEFWTAYMSNTNPPGGDGGSTMYLYITSDVNTIGNIEIVDGSYSYNFKVTANQVTTIAVPASAYLTTGGTYNKGIHITSVNPIAVYAHIFADQSSGATLLLPVNTMGKDYYSINYTQDANEAASSALMVIATEDSTTVKITSAPSTKISTTTTISLNKGQVYELLNKTDLTGTRIQSISTGSSTCKKIAVFSGSTRILIGCPNSSSDNLFQQVYPTSAWGEKYITVPLMNRPYDVFRVILSDANTILQVNGTTIDPTNFAKYMYYEFDSTKPNIIVANKPIQVAQYAVTQNNGLNCQNLTNDIGDPEMIFITPVEQTLNHVTLYATSNYKIIQSYINVLIPSNGVSSFILDGVPFTNFAPVDGNNTYSYAQIPVANGTHTISAGVGFNAITYGFGNAESYGYAAGANLANLNEYIALQNLQTDSLQYNGCSNEKYNLQLTLPYKTSKITWNFNDGTASLVQNNPVVSSTKINGTQQLYVYQYPKNPVAFSKRGNYTVGTSVFNNSADDCGSNEQVSFNFNISNLPVVDFDVDNTYVGIATAFKDETVPDTTIKTWSWDFGNGQTSGIQNPQNTYASPGKYIVTETVTDVDGCSSTKQKEIDVHITATPLTGSISACQGNASADPNIGIFNVSAGSLTAPLIITPPQYFEVSLSPDGGYAGTLTIQPSAGAVNNMSIYIRSAATAPAGNNKGNLAITSAGVDSLQFPVSGLVNLVPQMQPVSDVQYKNGIVSQPIYFSGKGNLFSWTNDTPSIGLAANGDTDIPSFTATNNSGVKNIIATITATPRFATVAYIANSDSNTVSIINTVTNTVVGNINISGFPEGIAACSHTEKVYISDFQEGTVSVVDANTNTVTTIINVGSNPLGICVTPDGSRVFVVNSFSNNISIIDGTTDKVIRAVSVGQRPVGVVTNADGSLVYVTNNGNNTVTVINTQTNNIIANINVGQNPYGMVLSTDGSRLYVANTNSNTVSVINTNTNMVSATINVGTSPYGVAITPDSKYVYITNTQTNNVSVISTSSNNVVATIAVGSFPYGISISPDGTTAYVANQGSGTVSIITTKTNTVSSALKTSLGPRSFGNFIITGSGCTGIPIQFHITVLPTPPVNIAAIGPLSSLQTTYGTSSVSTGFTISGSNLVSSINVIAPNGFEISKDKTNFTPTISLGDSGTVATTTVYVRIKATTVVGTYPNDVINIATKNADTLKTMIVPLGTVQAAPLTIKADNKSRPYGYANPVLTVSYSGFVNNEKSTDLTRPPVISTTATIQSPIGQYPITVDSAASTNYVFTYIPGTLTIAPTALQIPNTFTPNGDGINDIWDIKYLNYYTKCTVDIFNRYGTQLFHSIGYSIPWDGTFKGKALSPGTYYYIINLHNGTPLLSGYVAIIK